MGQRVEQWLMLGLGSDPVPADPSMLDGRIKQLTTLAEDADRARRGVSSLLLDKSLNSWMGASGDALRQACEPLPDYLLKLRQSYEKAAESLQTYQKALADARAKSNTAVTTAVSAYEGYGDGLGVARPDKDLSDSEYRYWIEDLDKSKFAHQHEGEPASASRYNPHELMAAGQTMLAARSTAQQAVSDNIRAANVCHEELDDAALLAARLPKVKGDDGGNQLPTFDNLFKSFGGDPAKLILDPSAGEVVDVSEFPPDGASAEDVEKWWDGLDQATRDRYIREHPGEIAALPGIPEADHDRAEKVLHPDPPHKDHDGHDHTGGGDHDPHQPPSHDSHHHRPNQPPPHDPSHDPKIIVKPFPLGGDHERPPTAPPDDGHQLHPVDPPSDPSRHFNRGAPVWSRETWPPDHPAGPSDPAGPAHQPIDTHDPGNPYHDPDPRDHDEQGRPGTDPPPPRHPGEPDPRLREHRPTLTDPTHPPAGSDPTHPPSGSDPTHPPTGSDPTHPPTGSDPTHPPSGSDPTHPPSGSDPTHPPTGSDPTHPPANPDPTHPPASPDPKDPSMAPRDPSLPSTPDPVDRITMPAPGTDPQPPVPAPAPAPAPHLVVPPHDPVGPEHTPVAPSHEAAPSTTSPSDYQVASAPQHVAPSAENLTGPHSGHQNVSAPDSAPGYAPQADLSPDADQWAAGPAVHVDAGPAAGQWTHGPAVLRAGASMDPVASGLDAHAPRAGVGMDVGAAPAGAWTPAGDQVLTGPDAFTPAHSAATADIFVRVGDLAAEATQPPHGTVDPLPADGFIPGTVPPPSGSFPGDLSQPADVPQTTPTADIRHEDGRQGRHTVGERYYE